MSNIKKSITKFFEPEYDSDEDLDPRTQYRIKNTGSPSVAENIRKKAWDDADAFTKIKSVVKGAYYGDKRNK